VPKIKFFKKGQGLNLITGEKFFELADYICHGLALENVKNPPNICKPHKVLVVEGHNFAYAIEHIRKMQHETFILISHNSDANILDHPARDFDYNYSESKIPINVKKIFAQNLDVLSDRIRPLPIGLENFKWHKGKKWQEIESMIPQEFQRDKWLYVNHAIATNPKEREEPYRIFKNTEWATCKGKVSYLEYLTDLKQHKFRICPYGNGLDTHSIWETLYMGCVPIVKKAVFTDIFSNHFPMIMIDEWKNVTIELMDEVYDLEAPYEGEYYKAKLDFDFWEKVIKGEIEIS